MYGNIPEEILNIEIVSFIWHDCANSLRSELDRIGEEIIFADWIATKDRGALYPKLNSFTAWTENKVIFLVTGESGDQAIFDIPRNPIYNNKLQKAVDNKYVK